MVEDGMPDQPGPNRQTEVYMEGLADVTPDRVVAALDALPEVADEVGEEATVLFDSGIRRGADALIALALGADAGSDDPTCTDWRSKVRAA